MNILKFPGKLYRFIVRKYYLLASALMNNRWSKSKHVLSNIETSNLSILKKFPHCRNLEHHICRYHNMNLVISEVKHLNITGDILEFGTYQGVGLILLGNLCSKILDDRRLLIGIDCFEGLPHSARSWGKGKFSDTDLDIVYGNINKFSYSPSDFRLIKSLFSDSNLPTTLESYSKDFSIVHFDADLGSSTLEAFTVVNKFLLDLDHPVYFLFDDWGCDQDEVPEAFYSWLNSFAKPNGFKATKLYTTKLTRYYKIERS